MSEWGRCDRCGHYRAVVVCEHRDEQHIACGNFVCCVAGANDNCAVFDERKGIWHCPEHLLQCHSCGKLIPSHEEAYQSAELDGTVRNPASPDYSCLCADCFFAAESTGEWYAG